MSSFRKYSLQSEYYNNNSEYVEDEVDDECEEAEDEEEEEIDQEELKDYKNFETVVKDVPHGMEIDWCPHNSSRKKLINQLVDDLEYRHEIEKNTHLQEVKN